MNRKILSFEIDQDHEWRVILDCGHRRHLRHDPPRETRPQLDNPEARQAVIGRRIECGRCTQRMVPEGAEIYKSTKVFTEKSLPQGLLQEHSLKPGVWGALEVMEGSVIFCEGGEQETLGKGETWTVLPEVVHYLKLKGPVKLRINFLKVPEF